MSSNLELEMGIEMGSNDFYVIKKLKESEITLERIDQYLSSVYMCITKDKTQLNVIIPLN